MGIAIAGFLVSGVLHIPQAALSRASSALNCDRPPGYILLLLDNTGFNDSVKEGHPTFIFQRGETVNVLVCNLDSVQAHGFAIDHYFDGGVTLRPGDAYRVSFVARDTGSFTIYCNVFCTVHTYMLGKLIVS